MDPASFHVRVLSLRASAFCQCLGFHIDSYSDRSTSSDFKTSQVCYQFSKQEIIYLYIYVKFIRRHSIESKFILFDFNSARPSKLTAKIIIAGIWLLAGSLATPMAIARRVIMEPENPICKFQL